MFVVEPEFAPGDAFFVLGDFADGVPVVRLFIGVERMNAGGAPDIVVFFGDAEGIVGIYGRCGDGDDPGDARLGSVIEDLVDAPCVVGEGKVGVGVDHGGMIGKLCAWCTIMNYG